MFGFSPILSFFFFFFNDTATTEIYTLSLHDALPISPAAGGRIAARPRRAARRRQLPRPDRQRRRRGPPGLSPRSARNALRRPIAPADARVRSPRVSSARGRGAASRGAGDERRGCDPHGISGPGGGPGLHRERHHEPPALSDPRLDPVFRERQPDRASAAA